MPEVKPPNRQIVAAAMFFSAIVMFAVSMLFFTGAIDVGEDLRVVAGAAVAIAAAADLIAAVWFFRQGQSS